MGWGGGGAKTVNETTSWPPLLLLLKMAAAVAGEQENAAAGDAYCSITMGKGAEGPQQTYTPSIKETLGVQEEAGVGRGGCRFTCILQHVNSHVARGQMGPGIDKHTQHQSDAGRWGR